MAKEKGKVLTEGVAVANGKGGYLPYQAKAMQMRGNAAKQGSYKIKGGK